MQLLNKGTCSGQKLVNQFHAYVLGRWPCLIIATLQHWIKKILEAAGGSTMVKLKDLADSTLLLKTHTVGTQA